MNLIIKERIQEIICLNLTSNNIWTGNFKHFLAFWFFDETGHKWKEMTNNVAARSTWLRKYRNQPFGIPVNITVILNPRLNCEFMDLNKLWSHRRTFLSQVKHFFLCSIAGQYAFQVCGFYSLNGRRASWLMALSTFKNTLHPPPDDLLWP